MATTDLGRHDCPCNCPCGEQTARSPVETDEPVWEQLPETAVNPLGGRPPELQIQMVASPRNQLYLDQAVAGIWRPLAACSRAQHSRQVALQGDLQLIAVG